MVPGRFGAANISELPMRIASTATARLNGSPGNAPGSAHTWNRPRRFAAANASHYSLPVSIV
jgi:hypothetical protein